MANETLAVYQHLIACAVSGHTTTYEETAQATGLPSSGNALGATLSPLLTNIFNWCKTNRHPHLTSLVVRKSGQDEGLPGRGFWQLLELPDTMSRETKRMMTSVYQWEVFKMYRKLNVVQLALLDTSEDAMELVRSMMVGFKDGRPLENTETTLTTYFPILMKFSDTGKTEVIRDTDDLPSGRAFKVLAVNHKG